MTTPAGWYDDGSGSLRWWDGTQWTAHVRASEGAPAASVRPSVEPVASELYSPDTAPFTPPYALPSSGASTERMIAPVSVGAPDGAWGVPSAQPPAPGVSVLGVIGLAMVVVGVVCACIPVISIVGWALLGVGFVLSLVSLFLRGRKWPGITGLAVAAIGALLAVAVSLLLVATVAVPTDDAASTEGGTDPSSIEGAEMVPFAELEVGDCLPFVDYEDTGQIYELPVVPCEKPHTDEVYFIFEVDDEEFPGEEALSDAASDGCAAHFDTYVGIAYEDSVLDFYSYQPTETSWARADDRTVQCILFSYDDVTGTLEGAKY
ncbi:MAG: hypothetical protein K0R99_3433 [Microbacterium sp.]|jgi:hypothetical protein|uniref:DUF2510 domain-containing protein n=1 Tax=Microbacterium sp. TaxID=51671 RepID=UPI002622ADDB|nr:DUF2510 domain-containing protein [Microbacterium sp.]MDF2561987.1 hypothetical protein [Microbacterium sp.]